MAQLSNRETGSPQDGHELCSLEDEPILIELKSQPLEVETSITTSLPLITSYLQHFRDYARKFSGVPNAKPPSPKSIWESNISGLISFVNILVIAVCDYLYLRVYFPHPGASDTPVVMLTGAFAATSVLVCDLHSSPVAQPRNVIGSYLLSGFVGVSTRYLGVAVGIPIWVQAALAVYLAVFLMNIFRCVHPPGGATALIAVVGGAAVWNLGYAYILTSLGGAVMSVAVATLLNNLVPSRQYPLYWY